MRIVTTIIFAVAAIALTLTGPAPAQDTNPTCAGYDKQIAIVQNERYAEGFIGRGLSTSGNMIELLRSQDGGTWTILMTSPNGTSCVLRAGEFWEDISWQDPRGKQL